MELIKIFMLIIIKFIMSGKANSFFKNSKKITVFLTVFIAVALFNFGIYGLYIGYNLLANLSNNFLFLFFIILFLPTISACGILLSVTQSKTEDTKTDIVTAGNEKIIKRSDLKAVFLMFIPIGIFYFIIYGFMNGWDMAFEKVFNDMYFSLITFFFLPLLSVSIVFSYVYENRKNRDDRKL